MKMMKDPKVLIMVLIIVIYAVNQKETREGFGWNDIGNAFVGKVVTKKKKAKTIDYEEKYKGCLDDYDELMAAYTGYMKKNSSKTPKMI